MNRPLPVPNKSLGLKCTLCLDERVSNPLKVVRLATVYVQSVISGSGSAHILACDEHERMAVRECQIDPEHDISVMVSQLQ